MHKDCSACPNKQEASAKRVQADHMHRSQHHTYTTFAASMGHSREQVTIQDLTCPIPLCGSSRTEGAARPSRDDAPPQGETELGLRVPRHGLLTRRPQGWVLTISQGSPSAKGRHLDNGHETAWVSRFRSVCLSRRLGLRLLMSRGPSMTTVNPRRHARLLQLPTRLSITTLDGSRRAR